MRVSFLTFSCLLRLINHLFTACLFNYYCDDFCAKRSFIGEITVPVGWREGATSLRLGFGALVYRWFINPGARQ